VTELPHKDSKRLTAIYKGSRQVSERPAALICWWKFDETEGEIAEDSSGTL
jgi:hypothetical protein